MGRPSKYSAEFRRSAVELVESAENGETIAGVARDLGINDTTLGNWVKASRAERGEPDASGTVPLNTEERAELARLRREVTTLRQEREILKKAAAFFVKESTR